MNAVSTHSVECDCGWTILFYGDDTAADDTRATPARLIRWHNRMMHEHPEWNQKTLRVIASEAPAVVCPGCGREHEAPIPELLDADRGGLFSA